MSLLICNEDNILGQQLGSPEMCEAGFCESCNPPEKKSGEPQKVEDFESSTETCRECYANVDSEYVGSHLEWHYNLERYFADKDHTHDDYAHHSPLATAR
jgi:hypothetical protein